MRTYVVPPRYSQSEAQAAIQASKSFTEALRRLGMCSTGGSRDILKKYARLWAVPVDHFDPLAGPMEALRRHAWKAIPLEEVLVDGRAYSRGRLKARLYETGLKKRVRGV